MKAGHIFPAEKISKGHVKWHGDGPRLEFLGCQVRRTGGTKFTTATRGGVGNSAEYGRRFAMKVRVGGVGINAEASGGEGRG